MLRSDVNLSPLTGPGTVTRVALYTLGCKVNQAETDTLGDEFVRQGFRRVRFEEPADVYIVNTCTVTHVGDAKSRQILRQAARRTPGALVVATGCYASIVGNRLPIEGVLVVKNRDKDRLIDIVRTHVERRGADGDLAGRVRRSSDPPVDVRGRAMVKVQDGCDSACSYCIIPRARGRSRSVDPARAAQRVQALVERGHQEIVITGVDLGSYGDDRPDFPDLGGLLRLLLENTDAHRFRVSSLEPGDFKLDWLDLWGDHRLCRHLHVPLQAGSDTVLARMRRRYGADQFLATVQACRRQVPGIAITTDVITGFPGETEEEFGQGLRFMERCRFDGMHVFPYSRRSGTAAAAMPDSVPDPVRKTRAALLRAIGEQAKAHHVARSLGAVEEVVWESRRDGVCRGMTGTNLRVYAADHDLEAGSVDDRLLTARYADGCWGEPPAHQARLPDLNVVAV